MICELCGSDREEQYCPICNTISNDLARKVAIWTLDQNKNPIPQELETPTLRENMINQLSNSYDYTHPVVQLYLRKQEFKPIDPIVQQVTIEPVIELATVNEIREMASLPPLEQDLGDMVVQHRNPALLTVLDDILVPHKYRKKWKLVLLKVLGLGLIFSPLLFIFL